jgi:hypothetical protein
MKKLITIFCLALLIITSGAVVGDVVIKQEPLTWQHVENADGNMLFNNLCAACHGAGAKGDGPAASALDKGVPDLTTLAFHNDGVYPYGKVQKSISGKTISGEYRRIEHGTIDMPVWEQQFMYLQPGWTNFQREAYARRQVYTLNSYIKSIQVN